MLTTTYSLIVFSTEQNGIRTKIASLRDHIQQAMRGISAMDNAIIDDVLTQLNHFHECAQSRKVDIYLITRMRQMSQHAASLLAELESLGLLSLNILRSIREKLAQAIERGGLRVAELQEAVELYCAAALQKVDKEENELFPMASRLLTAEDWFQVARQLLSHNTKIGEAQRSDDVAAPTASQKASTLLDQASSYSIAIPKVGGADRRVLAHPLVPERPQRTSPHASFGILQSASGASNRTRQHS